MHKWVRGGGLNPFHKKGDSLPLFFTLPFMLVFTLLLLLETHILKVNSVPVGIGIDLGILHSAWSKNSHTGTALRLG